MVGIRKVLLRKNVDLDLLEEVMLPDHNGVSLSFKERARHRSKFIPVLQLHSSARASQHPTMYLNFW